MTETQAAVCRRIGATPDEPLPGSKVGVARNVRTGEQPLNALRHPAEGDACGWYVWSGEGEPSADPDFFVALHVEHLAAWCPQLVPYLALPAGWRVLLAPGHEDVWHDERLLDV